MCPQWVIVLHFGKMSCPLLEELTRLHWISYKTVYFNIRNILLSVLSKMVYNLQTNDWKHKSCFPSLFFLLKDLTYVLQEFEVQWVLPGKFSSITLVHNLWRGKQEGSYYTKNEEELGYSHLYRQIGKALPKNLFLLAFPNGWEI